MDGKLSKKQLDAMRIIDAGDAAEDSAKLTLGSLWRRGLITDYQGRLILTDEGRLALRYGRQMLSKRSAD